MANKDYYATLEVEKTSSAEDIKKAYRRLAKKYHPDMNKEDDTAAQKFKEINEAYQVLSDDEKRAKYDQFGSAAFDGSAPGGGSGFGGFGGFGDFSDIFDSFFGGGMRTRRNAGPMRGADVQAQLKITFEEAVFGAKKNITITRKEHCETCGGTGAKSGSGTKTCPTCGGAGQVRREQRTVLGSFMNVTTCPQCEGEGKIVENPCDKCRGSGNTMASRTITVTIPAGIDDNQVLTLSGQGDAGGKGAPSGDLNVFISVRPHKIFKRDGVNLYMDLPITFGQAALGAELEIPTLDNKVKYTLEPGTQTGTVFRLRDKGIKYLRQDRHGDLFVKVNIEVPKKLTDRQKELLAEFDGVELKDIKRGKGIFSKK